MLGKIRAANSGKRLPIVRANPHYQWAAVVQAVAKRLRIRLLFPPPYSPNLNLIERFWKFLRKQVLRNTYYPTFDRVAPWARQGASDMRGAVFQSTALPSHRSNAMCHVNVYDR